MTLEHSPAKAPLQLSTVPNSGNEKDLQIGDFCCSEKRLSANIWIHVCGTRNSWSIIVTY